MVYQITALSSELIFVKWSGMPDDQQSQAYLNDVRDLVEKSPHPIFFVSDLRYGHITSARVLREMGKLTSHRNYGGGPCLTPGLTSQVYVSLFERFAEDGMERFVCHTVEELLIVLETLKPGITGDYEWDNIFNLSHTD